jgi:DHA1 family bicyclomycin/chloramphenicol resistance-like MFS transporter
VAPVLKDDMVFPTQARLVAMDDARPGDGAERTGMDCRPANTGGLTRAPAMSERRVALLGGLLAGIGPLSLALFTPAMPAIAGVFSASDAAVKATLSVYFAGFAVAQLICGPLSDRFGRRPVTLAFLLVYVAGSLGTLIVSDIALLLCSRGLQGIGAAAGIVIARAIVRDLFIGEASARVMNITNIIVGAGPAIAPAIGGGAMMIAGWQAPFVAMLVLGVAALVLVRSWLVETRPLPVHPLRVRGLIATYLRILRSPDFLWPSLTIAGAVSAFYAQSTVLSFIVMGRLGYSSGAFGLIMLIAASGFFAGSNVMRFLNPRYGAFRIIPVGLILLGGATLALLVHAAGPSSLVGVVAPVTILMFGNALILPGMYTASLAPFGDSAGAASALSGFMSMGLGLLASLAISLVPDPALGLGIVAPAMAAVAVASYLNWRRTLRRTRL